MRGFEKYDQTSYRYLIQFLESGAVKKGVPDKGKFHEVGCGTYTLSGSTVTCIIRSVADGFESKWIGEIKPGFIQFKIENPDFEDIEGKYGFVQAIRT